MNIKSNSSGFHNSGFQKRKKVILRVQRVQLHITLSKNPLQVPQLQQQQNTLQASSQLQQQNIPSQLQQQEIFSQNSS